MNPLKFIKYKKFNNYLYSYKEENKNILKKIKYSYILIIIILIIVTFNIYKLQISKYKFYKKLSINNFTQIVPIIPNRGLIYDKNNILLTKNNFFYNINIIKNKNTKKILKQLKSLNIITQKKYLNLIKNIKKKKIIKIKKIFNKKKIQIFYLYKNLFKNCFIEINKERFYPYKNITAAIIGYVINKKKIKNNKKFITIKKNYIGNNGLEKYYENILHGKIGLMKIIKDNKAKIIKVIKIKKSIPGKNIQLNIDIKLQKFIFNLIKNDTVAIIISNPKNGNILSMISTPTYNPNLFNKNVPISKHYKLIKNHKYSLINRTIQGIYPPASTIKPYIGISALTEKIIDTNFKIYDPGWWILPNSKKKYYDWNQWGHGNINILSAIEESSDTFFYQIAYKMGINKIYKWMKIFGYGEKTLIDLPNENKGNLPNKQWKKSKFNQKWYLGDTISIGIGQGYLTATPIQIHRSLLLLINNGTDVPLHIIKYNKYLYKKPNKKIKNVKLEHWNIIKQGMYGVGNNKNGTAYKNFKNTKYKVAVKSGTAQIFTLQNYERYKKNYITKKKLKDHILMNTFVPYINPKIAITIILEHGSNNTTVGTLTKKITDYIYYQTNLIK